ncbi:pilus assembly protein TadG [Sphingomonas koreensis]|jgi:Flp pilus assembly protein TadG|uniref:Pilus assembly protein TadG n=2 Tax=Sphingomonas koreensis TaxID=93064 RepID=A0AAJ4S572_9SPHN|nr:TadE/TadG family type IV pilus assembly protein [Sphingomonas koreensis]MDC7810061.1 pilus assembly protein TadG-related protein [Sphingomonas koreensis]RSU24620.1 pilus assembly protein TadG [Sphingomonas koreensis]RSU27110.1 pilus assembly protein TadG [Sphingomonas koreensis]RSU30058.1 pilus assembly protein TadG [Sphingomonas koreensis]RSU32945.1 pilus assembly protein TadG [Sphingomonas koreensis]
MWLNGTGDEASMIQRARAANSARTWLTSLARDTRGNTIAIIAASIIPLAGMVGGGVDISRMYIVKTRLQHACDAGALAGRKLMGGGSWSANNYAARDEAGRFFDANFNPEAYGTTLEAPATRRSFTESAGKVTGTARAVVPMTLMRVFGKTSETLTVSCDAEMRLPNTDVMFVLDTTGSMNYCPNGSSSCNGNANSRIAALRVAVKCFYQIVARLDVADVDCEGDEPNGGTGNQVQIRFGFVPYSTNVNVGRLLPNDYFVDQWDYQTRRANMAVPPQSTSTYWETYGGGSINQSECLSFMKNEAFGSFTPTAADSGGPAPEPTVESSFPHDGSATQGTEWGWWGASDTNGTTRSCRRRRTDTTTFYVEKFASWTYNQMSVNVSGLKAGGSNWNSSFTMPSSLTDPETHSVADPVPGSNGRDIPQATITWSGCIEERQTDATTDYDPIPTDALDLNIDMVPNSDESRWKPALPQLIFTRARTSGANFNYTGPDWVDGNTGSWNVNPVTTSTDYNNSSMFFCPTEARKLISWTDPSDFQNYVNSLTPAGNTYHDIGMIWGARLMSPTGIFRSENEATPNGGEIERHMIFMTDGDTNANNYDYSAYGLPFFDARQTPGNPSKAQLEEQVNLRFLAICRWVRNKRITLWVINFGEGQSQATQDRLEQCASEGRYFSNPTAADLQSTFKSIADQISQLRLTR